MIEAEKYTISVRYGELQDDYCYEVPIEELPTIAEYAGSSAEAYVLAIDRIETTARLYAELGRSMPVPSVDTIEDYSRCVTLRMPKSLNHSLQAGCEDVSLNQLIVSVLFAFHGFGSVFSETKK